MTTCLGKATQKMSDIRNAAAGPQDLLSMIFGNNAEVSETIVENISLLATKTAAVNIGISVVAALLATAVFAIAIAAIDARNIQAYRIRRSNR